MLIEFCPPSIEIAFGNYAKLPGLLEKATSGIGIFISIAEQFSSRGISEVEQIVTTLRSALGIKIIPRIVQSYALVFWFTFEVSIT